MPRRTVSAAVPRDIGRPAPFAASRPLVVEEPTLVPPGRGEVCVRIAAAGEAVRRVIAF